MSALRAETVLDVEHWTENLFSFKTTRSPSFRFDSGQFVMIGLEIDGKPLLRAYSMAGSAYDDTLSFFSIKVANGPLTSKLQNIKVGDPILVGAKPTGTLVLDNVKPGRNLYLLSTGTGLAPFLSIIRDPRAYERFAKVVLVHGCRFASELTYGRQHVEEINDDPLVGEMAANQLIYYPAVTREPFTHRGRITQLINSGRLTSDIGLPPLDSAFDRAMLCGSPAMIGDLRTLLTARGFNEGASHTPGEFVIEKAFVEK